MYKLDIPIDHDETAIIEARRRREEQRKNRIFDARVRQIGIDIEGLNCQVIEKKNKELYEKQRDLSYEADSIRNDKISVILQNRQERDLKELKKGLDKFRLLHQKPEYRREFDLYDPDLLKKEKPARVSDDDPRCGVSSIQKFDGEDLNHDCRIRYQREQMENWFDRQMAEKKRSNETSTEANRLYDLKRRELNKRACDLDKAESDCRRAINKATERYNELLRIEMDQRKLQKQKEEQEDNMQEICNSIYGDFLSENPAQALSAFGAHRVIPDRFKGMSVDQLKEIRRIQLEQIKERKCLFDEEKNLDKEWDTQQLKSAKLGLLIEKEIERSRKRIDQQIFNQNQKLAYDQNSYKKYLDKEVYTNPLSSAYFHQFNTTSR